MRSRYPVALLLLAQGVLLAIGQGSPGLPVRVAGLALPTVQLGLALGVLLVGAAALRLTRIPPRTLALADAAWTFPVTVFLVAAVNGVTDAAALIALYALMGAAVLLAILQLRVTVTRGHPLLPLCFAAGAGIVPWGVIALVEVAATIAGRGPAGGVRIATLVVLAAQLATAATCWRDERRGAGRTELVQAVGLSVSAWALALLA